MEAMSGRCANSINASRGWSERQVRTLMGATPVHVINMLNKYVKLIKVAREVSGVRQSPSQPCKCKLSQGAFSIP